jgi:hypothetical protein
MKQIFTFLFVATITLNLLAQSPEKMSYQAIIRDAQNTLVSNTTIGMQISILQGSEDGTAVYIETHIPMTNSNGLVTLEIGTGETNDDFSAIDWTLDTYFVKTETDPAGGVDYSITGISQLLSVPYALHAKTAENISGGFTETDAIFAASEAAKITEVHIAGLDSLSGTNKGDQSISRTGLTISLTNGGTITDSVNTQSLADVIAISNIADGQIKNVTDPTNAQDAATKAYVDLLEAKLEALAARIKALEPPAIGDFRSGGIVFYIFKDGDAGYVIGENHGLVCAVSDHNGAVDWTTANSVCNNLSLNTYSDWVLPSQDELNKIYQNKTTINNKAALNGGSAFSPNFYWSSTEDGTASAYLQAFDNGGQYSIPKTLPNKVRAIRCF